MNKKLLAATIASSAIVAPYVLSTDTVQAAALDMTIFHTNDTHAHVETAGQRAALVKQLRAAHPNNLLLDAGDVFSGTLYFNEWKGKADLEIMNYLK
ncbi:MAG TPA: metallophosphoesterase, partial [Metalysinibacillus sp.]